MYATFYFHGKQVFYYRKVPVIPANEPESRKENFQLELNSIFLSFSIKKIITNNIDPLKVCVKKESRVRGFKGENFTRILDT